MSAEPVFDDNALIRAASAFVVTLRDTGKYPVSQIKKALAGRMVDAYLAVEDKRCAAHDERLKTPPKRCAAGRDGECCHPLCPQILAGEPMLTGRHCPIDTRDEDA